MAISDVAPPSGLSLTLTDEHKMLQQAARDFAQKEIAPIAAEHDERGERHSNSKRDTCSRDKEVDITPLLARQTGHDKP